MKGPEEIQIHASISIVRHGDHYGITKEARQDDIKEVIQLGAKFPKGAMGNLQPFHIKKAMAEICEGFIKEARKAGIVKIGS